jgi:hypothetical protein
MPMIIQGSCQLRFSAKNERQMTDPKFRLVEFPTDSWEFPPWEPSGGVAR